MDDEGKAAGLTRRAWSKDEDLSMDGRGGCMTAAIVLG